MPPVPVIGISGHPGAGKTTLTCALATYFGVPALFYDDFETITSRPPAEIGAWMMRGSDYDEIDLSPLLVALQEASLARPRFILLDTLLGRAHQATGSQIALSLWLDVPADIALARKLHEASKSVGREPDRALDFAGWIAAYTIQYERFISHTYRIQVEQVRGRADVVLPRASEPETMRDNAIGAIEGRGF